MGVVAGAVVLSQGHSHDRFMQFSKTSEGVKSVSDECQCQMNVSGE